VLGEFSEPVAGDAAGDDLAWQRREQRIERAEVAAEEAADDVALGPEPRLTIAVLGNRSGVAASNCPTRWSAAGWTRGMSRLASTVRTDHGWVASTI
jgi:hypothetical protein